MYFYFFGDSITQGLWDNEGGGWVDRLKAHLQQLTVSEDLMSYNLVYNLGVDGDTTESLLKRFEPELKARLWADSNVTVIFAVGVNDTLFYADGKKESTLELYHQNLTRLVNIAQKYTANIIFIDILPVDEKRVNPLPQLTTGKCYKNDRIKRFNEVLYKLCVDQKLHCVRVSTIFSGDISLLLADGIHPNTKGHLKLLKFISKDLGFLNGHH